MKAVFSIGIDRRFADELAAGVLAEFGREPLALADVLILLPTRRSVRSLREAFLRASDGKPTLLPRLASVGGEHARRQLVGEPPVDADRVDARHRNTVSASARACGVPTWNHAPSWTRPNSRPFASARVHSFRSENGPSGESRNSRESHTETLANR